VTISNSEFSSNTAAAFGGGLADLGGGHLTVAGCTFNGNRAFHGGGLVIETSGTLSNTTISGNVAGQQGGGISIAFSGQVVLQNCTITDNQAGETAGGIFSGTEVLLNATVVAKNSAAAGDPDVDNNTSAADLVDNGENFIGDNTGAANSFTAGTPNVNGSFVGTAAAGPLDPLLEPLADNGGTVVLPDGSHLLTHQDDANNGNNGVRDRAPNGNASDERGFSVFNGACDIGAFEFQDCDLSVTTSAPAGALRPGQPATFTLAVTSNGPNACPFDPILTATLPSGTIVVSASGNATANGNVVTFLVPPLTVGSSTSFTLTVIPAASGPFTETATVSGHDDPNPPNNTASASVTVQPRAIPATGSADVTGLLQIVPQGRRRPKMLWFVRLTNASSTPIQGPLGVVVPGLRRGRRPKLLDAGGMIADGKKFVLVNVGSDGIFEPGQSVLVELLFSLPVKVPGVDVVAGALA